MQLAVQSYIIAPVTVCSLDYRTLQGLEQERSCCFLLASVRKCSAESGQEGVVLRVSQRHHQTIQDIRWSGEHLRGHALPRHIEVHDGHFKADDAPGLLRDQQCPLAVGALVGDVDLQVHYTALPTLTGRVRPPLGEDRSETNHVNGERRCSPFTL